MKISNFILTSLIILVVSCDKDKRTTRNSTDNMTIVYGNVCGWCGYDSLTITQNITTLSGQNYCSSEELNKTSTTHDTTWTDLTSSLDFQKFKAIDLNTCNVCVDGCDTWITIRTDSYYHKIRYGYDDMDKLKSIKSFIDELNKIQLSMNPK